MTKNLSREDDKRDAKIWLNAARGGGLAPACIDRMRSYLKEGNWTLSDIGTSEDDLKTMLREYDKRQAKRLLELARTTGEPYQCIEEMHYHLMQGNLTLVDIGTSEDDLKMVPHEYHKCQAKRLLELARTTGNALACINEMRDHLKQSNMTLVDIGTSEHDLKMVIHNFKELHPNAY